MSNNNNDDKYFPSAEDFFNPFRNSEAENNTPVENAIDSLRQAIKEEVTAGKKDCRCGEATATMLVNFGEEGRAVKGLVSRGDNLTQMVVKLGEAYMEAKENPITKGES